MLQEGQDILEGRFKIIKKLGSGAFGEIFKGKIVRGVEGVKLTDCSGEEKDGRVLCRQNSKFNNP